MTIRDFKPGRHYFAVISNQPEPTECEVVAVGTKYVTVTHNGTMGYREFYLQNYNDKFLTGKQVEKVPRAKLFLTEEEAVDEILTEEIQKQLMCASKQQKQKVLQMLKETTDEPLCNTACPSCGHTSLIQIQQGYQCSLCYKFFHLEDLSEIEV